MNFQYQLLPSLTSDEYETLKADIQRRGVQVPIEFDEGGNILDGHHRLRACEELGIKDYPSIVRVGMSEEEKTNHVLTLNLARRHLDKEQRRELEAKLRGMGWTYQKIAEVVKVDVATVSRNPAFANAKAENPPRIIGKDGKSYPSVFNKNKRDKQRTFQALEDLPADNLPNHLTDVRRLERLAREHKADERRKSNTDEDVNIGSCRLLLGDFREVGKEIPDNSVDLIFTDPPYPEEYLPLWYDLSAFANRVLKPNGMLIAYTGAMYLPAVMAGLGENLRFWWAGAIVMSGAHSRVHAKNIVQGSKPLLFYVRDCYEKGDIWLEDTFSSEGKRKDNHEWEQSVGAAIYYIEKFTRPDALIVDPFLGGGTTGLAAKHCGRDFVGIEIDAAHFVASKERLENG